MFRIYDGRENFWQWDINQKIIVEDNSITEVHFCNRSDNCSLVREIYNDGELRVVFVPNVLLQTNWPIRVYAYCKDHTVVSKTFKVIEKTKPEDYVYTPDEVKTWEELNNRITELEKSGVSQEVIEKAVEDYLKEHPITSSVVSVNGKTGEVKLTAADVGALPADTVIPSIAGLASTEYVDNAVADIHAQPFIVSVSKNESDGSITADKTISEIKAAYESGQQIQAKYAGDVDISPLILPLIAVNGTMLRFGTVVKQLGYLVISLVCNNNEWTMDILFLQDLNDYSLIQNVYNGSTTTEIPSAAATYNFVKTTLEVYAKKNEIPDTSNFITEAALNAKGYLTEHQSLAAYALKSEIPSAYSLPAASASTLGGIKVGTGLAVSEDGTLSLNLSSAEAVSF